MKPGKSKSHKRSRKQALGPPEPSRAVHLPASRSCRARRRLLKLAVILLPLLVLLLLELCLCLGGYGYPTAFFREKEIGGRRVLTENPRFGWRFFPPALAREPQPVMIAPEKPAGTLRIVVLGESAALGDPEPDYGFSRILEAMFRAAYTNARIEVVNAAMTAINSHAMLPIARECDRIDADFWIVYAGHNEVVGPYGSGTVLGARAPPLALIRAGLFLKTLKTGQLLDSLRQRLGRRGEVTNVWQGMEMFLNHPVPTDDPALQTVYRHYQANLEDILAAGKAARAKIIVCTAAANLKDCPPFGSLHRPGLSASDLAQWETFVKDGASLAASGQPQLALEQFRQALELDDRFAELHFRLARCLLDLGQSEAARDSYRRALDLDVLRFRIDSRLDSLTREIAGGREAEGIYLLDTARAIAEGSPQEIPGKELFWEHVHLNFDGNQVLARTVADRIAQLWPVGSGPANRAGQGTPWLSAEEAARQLGLTGWNRHKIAAEILQRIARPPFDRQLDHDRQMGELEGRMRRWEPETALASIELQAVQCRAALAAWPEDWRLAANLARLLREAGDLEGAVQQWQRVAELLPGYPSAYYSPGDIRYVQGKYPEAIVSFDRALALKPDCAEAWNGLGLCDLAGDRLDSAVVRFNRALRLRPYEPDFHYNLAIASVRLGRTNDAIYSYRQAISFHPGHVASHVNLANLLARAGRLEEAEALLRKFVSASPSHAAARNTYGTILARQRKPSEALAQFREAVRLEPTHLEARFNLATMLLDLRQVDEAITNLVMLLNLQPDWPPARQKLEQARRLKQALP